MPNNITRNHVELLCLYRLIVIKSISCTDDHQTDRINVQGLSGPPRRKTNTDYKELRNRGNVVLMEDYKVINTSVAYIIFFIVAGRILSSKLLIFIENSDRIAHDYCHRENDKRFTFLSKTNAI